MKPLVHYITAPPCTSAHTVVRAPLNKEPIEKLHLNVYCTFVIALENTFISHLANNSLRICIRKYGGKAKFQQR